MKHIVIITGVFPPEPVTTAEMNFDLALELSKDYRVTVLRPFPSRPEGTIYPDSNYDFPFECITVKSYTHPQSDLLGRFKESISFAFECKKYLESNKGDVDFVYNASWQLFGYWIIALICNKLRIPYIVPIQDIYPECLFTNKNYPGFIQSFFIGLLKPIDRYYQAKAYRVRTISNEMAGYLSRTRHIPLEKYLVLDNWQNDSSYVYSPPSFDNSIISFGYVGSINAHSNVELIIRAFNEADIPNSSLEIFGGGPLREQCMELAEHLHLGNVSFNIVNKEDVPIIQSKLSVLVLALPKGNGGLCLPSKMTSYMLSGRPILASVDPDSATARYINEANCGLVVAPDSVANLSDGFKYFASLDFKARIIKGENSRKFAINNLSKDVNLAKVVDSINLFLG